MTPPAPVILLFGGTFDPPHLGHTAICRTIAAEIGAHQVLCIPAALSPAKEASPTPAHHRIAMLERALANDPLINVSTIEIDRGGRSYFVETLHALRESVPDEAHLRFLIGADHALGFHTWREPDTILTLATPVIVARPPQTPASLRAALLQQRNDATISPTCDPEWIVDAPLVDVSATEIRERLRTGERTDDLLDRDVAQYIAEHALYS